MSINIMKVVFEDTTIKGNEKLLMLALADNSNDSGICFPNWNTLMKKTSMSKGSLSKWFKVLEEKEILFRKARNRKNGSRTSNKFLLYPLLNRGILDEEDYLLFEDLYKKTQSKVQELNSIQSSEVEPSNGGQSSEVEHLEPSLNSNHHLAKKYNSLMEMWNRFAKVTDNSKITAITSKRRLKIQTRFKDYDNFIHLFDKSLFNASNSDYLKNVSWFSFDWLIENDTNIIKVYEGKYNNKKPKTLSHDEYK